MAMAREKSGGYEAGYIGGILLRGKDGKLLTPNQVQATACIGNKDPRAGKEIQKTRLTSTKKI